MQKLYLSKLRIWTPKSDISLDELGVGCRGGVGKCTKHESCYAVLTCRVLSFSGHIEISGFLGFACGCVHALGNTAQSSCLVELH